MMKVAPFALLPLLSLALLDPCTTNNDDADGDGYTETEGDCDDGDASTHPGADEICDGVDNDCDGLFDGEDGDLQGTLYFQDEDSDGAGDPATALPSCGTLPGAVTNGLDCDDGDPAKSQLNPGSCEGAGVYVLSPDGGDGAGGGFDSIQEALDSVEEGALIYLEPGDYVANLNLPRGEVHLLGTYPGYVRIDGSQCLRGPGLCSVILASWEGEGGVLPNPIRPRVESLVLRGGMGTSGLEFGGQASRQHGGGICVADANPMFKDIRAEGNESGRGGGLFVYHDGPSFESLSLVNNRADTGGGGYVSFGSPAFEGLTIDGNEAATGGGIAIDNGDPRISDGRVTNNSADYGAGLNLTLASPILTRVYVTGNIAGDIGGGYYIYDSRAQLLGGEVSGNSAKSGAGINLSYAPIRLSNLRVGENLAVDFGGGIYAYESNMDLDSVTVEGNRAGDGGGMNLSYSHIRGSRLVIRGNEVEGLGGGIYASSSRPQINNAIISDNAAGTRGGGIFESYSDITLEQVTVVGNRAGTLGGGFYGFMESNPTLEGSILAFNSAGEAGDNIALQESSEMDITYSLLWDGAGAGVEGVSLGVNDVVADPLFVNGPEDGDLGDDDYHLGGTSPAIDAGPPSPTSNDPDGSRGDMGAYGGPGSEGF